VYKYIIGFYPIIVLFYCFPMENNTGYNVFSAVTQCFRGGTFFANDRFCLIYDKKWVVYKIDNGQITINQEVLFEGRLNAFCLNKNGILAMLSDQLSTYDIHTGKRLSCRDNDSIRSEKIFLYPDNKTFIRHDLFGVSSAIEKNIDAEKFKRSEFKYRNYGLTFSNLAVNPKNNDVCFLNCDVNHVELAGDLIEYNEYCIMGVDINSLTSKVIQKISNRGYAELAEYSSNGTVLAINDAAQRYQFYRTDTYEEFLTIGLPRNIDKINSVYSSLAFHPKYCFVALLNIENTTIELWDYIKKTNQPFKIIKLKSKIKDKYRTDRCDYKCIDFSPDGNKILAINTHPSRYYVVSFDDNFFHKEFMANDMINKMVLIINTIKLWFNLPLRLIAIIIHHQLPGIHDIFEQLDQQREKEK